MRSLDLELLARIITNSPAMQGPLQPSQQSSQQQSRPTTNNFIININQSPGGGGSGGNPLADPQVMMASYLQNVMFQAMNGGNGQPQQQLMFQQQQQQQHQLQQLHQFQQQLALMGGSFGFQQQQQQQALMSALMSHQQSAILPMIGYGNAFGQPTPATTSSFFPNPNIITQQPTTTSFVDSFPSNSSFQLMQSPAANSLSSPYQQQQQENTEMQTGEMLQLSHRLSLHPYIESPALSSAAATSDVASEVGGGGGGTENASSIASTAHPATSVTSLENLRQQMQMHMQMQQQHQQQIQSESVNAAALPDSTVRFYGPYRAYYEPPSVNAGSSNNNQNSNHIPTTATIRNRNSQTATRRPNTTDWDTSFEDDEENDDDDNDDEMKVESVQSSQMKKKYA